MENLPEKTENHISDYLNIQPSSSETKISIKDSVKNENNESTTQDFELIRSNLKNIIAKSEQALDSILDVAQSCNEPRAFEVVAQLIQSTLDANTKLIETHKSLVDIENKKSAKVKVTENITNNAIFVGSTAELQKFMKEHKNKKELPKSPEK